MALDVHPLRALLTFFGYSQGVPPRVSFRGKMLDPTKWGPLGEDSPVFKWFQDVTRIASDRVGRYREYDMMDDEDILSSVLDMYSEDAVQPDTATGRVLWVVSRNPDIEKLANDLLDQVGMESKAFTIARGMAKYGDHFEAVQQKVGEGGQPAGVGALRTQNPYQISKVMDKFGRVAGFYVGDVGGLQVSPDPTAPGLSAPWDYIHWFLGGRSVEDPNHGSSLLAAARRTFKYLRLMEECLVLYRVRRHPDRLKWKVDVGDAPPDEANEIVQYFRQALRKNMLVDTTTGEIRSEMNPMSLDEDVFIPAADGLLTDVDVLHGSTQTGNVLDIEYMRKKLSGCVRVPPDYMGFADTSGTLSANTPLANQDIRYSRGVKRVQNGLMVGVSWLIQIDLLMRGIDVVREENEFTVRAHPVSYLDELQQAETAKTRSDIVTNLLTVGKELGVNQQKWLEYVATLSGFPEEVLSLTVSGELFKSHEGEWTKKDKEALTESLAANLMYHVRVSANPGVSSRGCRVRLCLQSGGVEHVITTPSTLVEAIKVHKGKKED